MKIGYPCNNWSFTCKADKTFRLSSYSDELLIKTISNNLDCLEQILLYNIKENLLFFRITSNLIPFASHPVCTFDWRNHFKHRFEEIGLIIKNNNIRISMHPDQFVLINAQKEDIVTKSIADLQWHCDVLDMMKLDDSAKIQIHVGGLYGDKSSAIQRFITNFEALPDSIKRRLVIENDDRLFSLKDCLYISEKTKIPILFDCFHHTCLHNGESICDAMHLASDTWSEKDGILMLDYSSQALGERVGKHVAEIDIGNFKEFIMSTKEFDFDIMLEIKDKEKSALKARDVLLECRSDFK